MMQQNRKVQYQKGNQLNYRSATNTYHPILCIDDDPDDLELLKSALQDINKPHRIVTASNGEEGLEKLSMLLDMNDLPCLIVLDVNMPKMDGIKTLDAIKANQFYYSIPVVIFSTAAEGSFDDFYSKYGITYFSKPTNYDKFCQVVDQFTDHCRKE